MKCCESFKLIQFLRLSVFKLYSLDGYVRAYRLCSQYASYLIHKQNITYVAQISFIFSEVNFVFTMYFIFKILLLILSHMS